MLEWRKKFLLDFLTLGKKAQRMFIISQLITTAHNWLPANGGVFPFFYVSVYAFWRSRVRFITEFDSKHKYVAISDLTDENSWRLHNVVRILES